MPIPILIALILVGLVGGLVYILGLTKKWGTLLPLAGMIFFSSIAMPLAWNDRVNPTVWLPIQSIRSEMFLASGVAALFVILLQLGRLKGKSFAISAILLVIIGFFASLLRFLHGGIEDGMFSMVFSFFTLLPLAIIPAAIIDRPEDIRTVFRVAVLVNAVWTLMVFVQIAANPKYVTQGNEHRFVGLMSNPQHTGVFLAFLSVIALWLLLNDQRKYRFFLIGIVSIDLLFLLWTGSRTGLGMAVVGISAVLYNKAGRAILLLPLVAILGYISLKIMIDVVGIDLGFERMTSTKNTRSDAWRKLIETAGKNPIVGVGMDELDRSENSWLYGYASYGIGMLMLLLGMTFVAAIEVLKSIKARFSIPTEYRCYLDVLNGIMMMYFAGAILEGYMVSRVSFTLFVFMLAAVANVNLRKILLADNYDLYEDQPADFYSDYKDYGDQEYIEYNSQ